MNSVANLFTPGLPLLLSTNPEPPPEQTTTVYPVKRFVYVIANITALSGLLFGYDIGKKGRWRKMQEVQETEGDRLDRNGRKDVQR